VGWQEQLSVLGSVALAMLLGGVIGIEREYAQKPAGLRTHMLVAGAAALLVGLVNAIVTRFATGDVSPLVRADPVRIISAVVTAVGFLGAGTIIRRDGDHVEGLTTAASMLFAATIGVAVGLRQNLLAAGVTGLTLLILRAVKWIEIVLDRRRPRRPPRD
jgi:putative Mg2+ transporter-C (MgtC) family protein